MRDWKKIIFYGNLCRRTKKKRIRKKALTKIRELYLKGE